MNTNSPRFFTRFLLTLLLAALTVSTATASVFRPAGLAPGDEYQLAFVTSSATDALSPDIDFYNDFVNAQAALNTDLTGTGMGVNWSAIASTPYAHARDNALVEAPVYLFDSSLVAAGFDDLWDGELLHSISVDQFGTDEFFRDVWTGSSTDGQGANRLGSPTGVFGDSGSSDFGWIAAEDESTALDFRLYALSEVLTVPTPRAKIRLDVIFSDPPTIADGQFPFGLSEFPEEIPASFLLGKGTPTGGGATRYGISDVISADFTLGDGHFTSLQEFDMELRSDGTFEALSWSFNPISTLSVGPPADDMMITMNSPLHIRGTDIASGEAFSYSYATSTETITFIPEPSTFSILCLAGWIATWRRRR